MAGIIKRAIKAVEPWYNWGTIYIERFDATCPAEMGEGEARFFDLQWFGLHFSVHVGRVPAKPDPIHVAKQMELAANYDARKHERDVRRIDWEESVLAFDHHTEQYASSDQSDEVVDAYVAAMDHLILNVPAPTPAGVALKIELAASRGDGAIERADFIQVIKADVLRLQECW